MPVSASDWERAFRQVRSDVAGELETVREAGALEAFRVRVVGRKGSLTLLLKQLKDLPLEDRKRLGPEGNRLRQELEARLAERRGELEAAALTAGLAEVREDLSLPPRPCPRGRRHPIALTMERMTSILSRLGFAWAEGPNVESDFYNFEALNIPPEHPARDEQDTFYLDSTPGKAPLLMRTHTSPVQIRAMRRLKPPIRIMAPGRVFRHEAVDATHSAVFHQVEGLYVDRKVTMADLKGTLDRFMKELFGPETTIRFAPSYFPFVEPGAEVQVSCIFCGNRRDKRSVPEDAVPHRGGKKAKAACSVCKGTGFIELLGAGLVHPKVLAAGGHDPKKFSGYAFGIGVERIAMMLFGIPDIRMFYENDLRFLRQFG